MPGPVTSGSFRQSVLVVDDDVSVRQALSFALDIEGFLVDVCESGEALLLRPMPPSPDCLVIDQRLPILSGIEALAVLRGRGVAVPAILITTAPTASLLSQAHAMGVRIVEKPLADGVLTVAIREALA